MFCRKYKTKTFENCDDVYDLFGKNILSLGEKLHLKIITTLRA